ncbi:hypothetical protein D3C86_1181830 [compost metagenome]
MNRIGIIDLKSLHMPVHPIRTNVVVDQFAFEIGGAPSPVNIQIVHKVAGTIDTTAIAHVPCFVQLPHMCIHKRNSGSTLTPLFEILLIIFKGNFFVFITFRLENFITEFHPFKGEKVPPNKLENEPPGALIFFNFVFIFFYRFKNFPWRYTA